MREIRVIGGEGVIASGYFDDPSRLAKAAVTYDGKANLYVTINPVDSSLLARAANRMKERPKEATRDVHIKGRSWLPIDIDAIRPSGISATDDEVASTLATARTVMSYLSQVGLGLPILSMSGNGCQMLYPIRRAERQGVRGARRGAPGPPGGAVR